MMCKKHPEPKKTSRGRSKGAHLSRIVALFTIGFLLPVAGWSGSGLTAISQEDPFAGVEVLGATEMAEKRGGFLDAALGISLSLGANIRTTINGIMILETMVTFVSGGETLVTHMVDPGADLTGLTFLSANGTAMVGTIPVTNTSGGPVTLTAGNGVQITVPAGFEGLVAQTDTGLAAAVNKITSEQFANLVINTDPGSAIESSSLTDSGLVTDSGSIIDTGSTILQTLNIEIDVQGFAALQQSIRFNATTERFRESLLSASLSALGIN